MLNISYVRRSAANEAPDSAGHMALLLSPVLWLHAEGTGTQRLSICNFKIHFFMIIIILLLQCLNVVQAPRNHDTRSIGLL